MKIYPYLSDRGKTNEADVKKLEIAICGKYEAVLTRWMEIATHYWPLFDLQFQWSAKIF